MFFSSLSFVLQLFIICSSVVYHLFFSCLSFVLQLFIICSSVVYHLFINKFILVSLTVDAQRLADLLPFINLVWSTPLQITVAMSLLYRELGGSVFAGLGVMILLLPLNGIFGAIQRKFQIKQMAQKDERIKIMNEILNGIKVIKLYSWEFSFMNTILQIRNKEIKK